MARTNNQITQQEIQTYKTWCQDNNVIADASVDGVENANLVSNYFLVTWPNEISPANLALAKAALMPHLRQYTPDQQEFNAVLAKLTPAEAQIFTDWKPPTGLKRNERAAVAILTWLTAHKFEITPRNLDLAVGQKTVQPFLEYEYVPTHVQSEHSRTDDGTKFLGNDLRKLPDGSYGKTRADYSREAREAAEKANPQTAENKLSVEDANWLRVGQEACRFGSHSQQAQIQKVYDQSTAQGLSPRKVAEACCALRNTFAKNEMIQDRSGYYRR